MAGKKTRRQVVATVRDSSSLISAFDALLGEPISDEPEEGFFSLESLSKEFGLSECRTRQKLNVAVKGAKVERRRFKNDDGRACWFYRVKASGTQIR